MLPRRSRTAFSLIELSIVLVILGLLVGGILAGQSLIQAAELRKISTQYAQFNSATQAFRDKYLALPGDFRQATSFWGTAAGDGANAACYGSAVTTATCNGNGDGFITGSTTEFFRYWQHLALAGLIEGAYTGVSANGNYAQTDYSPQNSPTTINNAYWYILSFGLKSGASDWIDGKYDNTFQIGRSSGAPTSSNYFAFLRPADMWNIDKKIDDGKPATGIMLARRRLSCTDGINGADFDADYSLDISDIVCTALIKTKY